MSSYVEEENAEVSTVIHRSDCSGLQREQCLEGMERFG